ncbi:protein ADM2-like [Myxocyprinus asiaticus]|uniref:protein ADM2-like n=1 Tax=Myxocyprinus asiaticus TaxID=70543 RepID=UPI00222286EC|nr:protein ADM2-like [Myxocyprinus asiaticus]
MKSLLLVCVFLLPLQTLAMPVRNRLIFPRNPGKLPERGGSIAMETSMSSSTGARERHTVWRALVHTRPPATPSNQQSSTQGYSWERRHVHRVSRGHTRGQLMRMGCVLGTCQVQNLSHRLYQLTSQSGRQDSPINPRSPHSYG